MSYQCKKTGFLDMPRTVRCDPEMRDAVRKIADANYRTMQAQILAWIVAGIKREIGGNSGIAWGPKVVRRKEKRA